MAQDQIDVASPQFLGVLAVLAVYAYLVVGAAIIIFSDDIEETQNNIAEYMEIEDEDGFIEEIEVIDTNAPPDSVTNDYDYSDIVYVDEEEEEYQEMIPIDPEIPIYDEDEEEIDIPEYDYDWNDNTAIPATDGGDPLVFSINGDAVPNVTRNWPEQHESFLTEFDLYDVGENVTLSRTVDDGTMSLFIDLNGDGKWSNGTEWLFDNDENVYQILSRPLIDSNRNGWFDYSDDLWSMAMAKDGDDYYTMKELGIVAFNWSNHSHGHGDMFGNNRQYTDCLYEGNYYFPNCVAVSDSHFAIVAYNQNSILLNDGRILDSFGAVMGHLEIVN